MGMRKILVYFYNEEITMQSTTSVTRLVASLINGLQKKHAISYFTFQAEQYSTKLNAETISLSVPKWAQLKRKINNSLGFKRIQWFGLKRNAVRRFATEHKDAYDAVLVLGLDDLKEVRRFFPKAKILYWIHNISAICKKEYLYNVNDADFFLSPSRTTYHLLLEKLQPQPLTSEFYFIPNWCEEVFKQRDEVLINTLKEKHAVSNDSIVFIFSGSDLKLKGRFLIEKVIKKLATVTDQQIIFFFAGSNKKNETYQAGNIKIIDVGLLQPRMLAAYYHIALFGCFSSLAYDHCPLTLIEMVHCNVLPIASDIGGVKEILGNEHPFLVKEPHSVTAWVNYMQKAIELNSEKRMVLLNPLKEKVISIYNRNGAIEIFESILQSEYDFELG